LILVDTGPLAAICHPNDQNHTRAWEELKSLGNQRFLVCAEVLVECCFHLPLWRQRKRMKDLLEEIDAESPAEAYELSIREEVFEWLGKYEDHSPDWTDGLLVVVSGKNPRYRVWTHDREFKTIWRRPDGTVVPLAADLK